MNTSNNCSGLEDPDRLILQKSQLFTLQSHLECEPLIPNDMSCFLYETALNNPVLGLIPNTMHTIDIPSSATQISPQYKIPIAIQQQTKEELIRLEN